MPSVNEMLHRGVSAIFARRPAVPIALALITGVACESLLPTWPIVWLILGILFLAAAIYKFKRIHQPICLLISLFCCGVAGAQHESFCFAPSHIALFSSDEPKLAELELRIASPPRIISATEGFRPLPPKQSARAEVIRVKTKTGWQDATGDVLLTLDQPHPSLAVGQRIGVTGLLQRPPPAMNPGEFDAAIFYRKLRILATVTVPHVDGVSILAPAPFLPLEVLREKARHLLAAGFSRRHALDESVLLALTLGDRDPEMRDVQDDFVHSGTAHLLAVSGLHVLLVAGCVLLFCRLIGLHPRTAVWMMIAVTLFYSLITVPGAPVIRATVLCIAFGISQLSRRSRDGIQVLALCAIGLLIFHPHDLFSAGFQLSFVTVLGHHRLRAAHQ